MNIQRAFCFFLAGFLFSEAILYYPLQSIGLLEWRGALIHLFNSSESQWMVMGALLAYFVFFIALHYLFVSKTQSPKSEYIQSGLFHSQVILILLTAILCIEYVLDYEEAARSTSVITLVYGTTVYTGFLYWRNLSRHNSSDNSENLVHQIVSYSVVLLTIATLWQPDLLAEFSYRDEERWLGAWRNPNTNGLFMATGLILAIGWFYQNVKASEPFGFPSPGGEGPGVRATLRRRKLAISRTWALVILSALCICILAFGLLKSYSRGGWLSFVEAFCFFVFTSRKVLLKGLPDFARLKMSPALIRGTLTVLIMTLVCGFWLGRKTEIPVIRRAFSIANLNDFSWRNRVAGYQGAVVMIADKPFAGFGWEGAKDYSRNYYTPQKVDDWGAVTLNDYLMLAISQGLPVLTFLAILILISLSGCKTKFGKVETLTLGLPPPEKEESNDRAALESAGSGDRILTNACRAGVIVLLIGFFFDGGLFKFSLASLFWILLACSFPLEVIRVLKPKAQ